MSSDRELRVPRAMQPAFAEVTALTDVVCLGHLDAEYADLARRLAAALARKRPSPLLRATPQGWACGIVHALGTVNFLFDKEQKPYVPLKDLCALFGVTQSTSSARAREIRKMFGLEPFDPAWYRFSHLEQNPFVWMLETEEGFIFDARHSPRALQEELFAAGFIPFLPSTSREQD